MINHYQAHLSDRSDLFSEYCCVYPGTSVLSVNSFTVEPQRLAFSILSMKCFVSYPLVCHGKSFRKKYEKIKFSQKQLQFSTAHHTNTFHCSTPQNELFTSNLYAFILTGIFTSLLMNQILKAVLFLKNAAMF